VILAVNADRAVGPRTGVGRNLEYLLHAWARQDIPFETVRVVSPGIVEDLPEDHRFDPLVAGGRRNGLWWQTAHLRRKASGADVLFSFYTLPPGYRGRTVVANLGVYEGRHAIPGWRAQLHSRHFAYSARVADLVIVNAPSTAADLVEFYGVDPGKISVVWPGADERFRPAVPEDEDAIGEAVEALLGERMPYFLFVGKLSARRHVPQLLEAFRSVIAENPRFRMILAGPSGPGLDDELHRLGLTHSVRHVQHLDQDTLALLYRGARAFLMPTARDGFSHPILEAMGSGCPVLALRGAIVGALEFVDENVEGGSQAAVLYADDASVEAFRFALQRLAVDDELCAELGSGGLRCAAQFPSWDEHAADVMDILGEVAAR
jgi:glycosyltransferase involved in cell wall biosynthesis